MRSTPSASVEPSREYSATEFAELIERESDDVELKTGLGQKPLQEVLVAMSNTSGGSIFIGVTDDRRVSGRRRDRGVDDAIHEAALSARNVGRYRISQIHVDSVPVVVLDVEQRQDDVAQTSDGRVLRRRGGRNVAVFDRELWELVSSKALRRYEQVDSHVPASSVTAERAAAVALAHGWTAAHDQRTRWEERHLLHASGDLTVAGALLLTDPVESLAAAKFIVDIRSYEADDTRSYVRRESIGGSLQQQAERATDWVLRDIGTEIVVTGAIRHDIPRLPRRVVREAIANAVAHRDYSNDRTPIVIEIRPSWVRVVSPGQLPPPVTIDTLRDAQAPRNHTVIDVLRKFGLAEDSGQGIDVMQDDMRLELLAEPEFVEGDADFAVTLRLGGQISTTERGWLAEFERQGKLRRSDRLLLLIVLREGQVGNLRAREVLGVDSVDARAALRRLRDAGFLVQHGERGGAYYTLGVIGPDRTTTEVLLDAARSAPLTNQRVRELTGLERVPARRLLRRLVDEGRLVQSGERKATTYTLAASEKQSSRTRAQDER